MILEVVLERVNLKAALIGGEVNDVIVFLNKLLLLVLLQVIELAPTIGAIPGIIRI